MNDQVLRYTLRAIAVAIAIAALIDPAVTSNQAERPTVVVTSPDSARDASLAGEVARTLNKRYNVSRLAVAGANATVLVGDRLPDARDAVASPAFAILPDTTAPSVSIERVDVPTTVPSDSRVPVVARISVHGAAGRTLDATLRAGSVVSDHVTRRFARGDTTLSVPLSFVPTSLGAALIRVTATLSGVKTPAVADAATDVRDRRWPVLFYDPRPSWTSTFVRRSIERDPRFVVTSRTETSRGVSTDAGRPPARLDDLVAVSAWDAIVVGAPEGLSPTDVSGLENFMRRRGGTVVFLLDQRVAGPYDRLTGVATWTTRSTQSTSLPLARHDSATLRAGEIAFPSALPAGAMSIAGGMQPVVWETSVGAGRLIVSGALDAWRFRDPSTSGFDVFWRQTIAEAAEASPPPISIDLVRRIVSSGEWLDVRATVRSAAIASQFSNGSGARPARASVAASLERVDGAALDTTTRLGAIGQSAVALRLFPAGAVGEFIGRVRVPVESGQYRIVVASGTATANASIIVATGSQAAQRSTRDLVDPWARSRGGHSFRASEIDALVDALSRAIQAPVHLENSHPMRSGWWMLPFALALSGEWWFRRRRGLR